MPSYGKNLEMRKNRKGKRGIGKGGGLEVEASRGDPRAGVGVWGMSRERENRNESGPIMRGFTYLAIHRVFLVTS